MNKSKQSKSKKILIITCVSLGVIAFVVWLAYFVIPKTVFSGLTNFYMPNYATETAKPINDALIKAGAVRVCENPVSGRDPGNTQPVYVARYQFSIPEREVAEVLKRIASENGYVLASTPSDYGSIRHYEDPSSKPSPYAELESGSIALRFSTYSDTARNGLDCSNGKPLLGDQGHTGVSMSLSLPLYKHK